MWAPTLRIILDDTGVKEKIGALELLHAGKRKLKLMQKSMPDSNGNKRKGSIKQNEGIKGGIFNVSGICDPRS